MPALVVEVVGDTSGLSRDLKKAEAELKTFAALNTRRLADIQEGTVRRAGASTIDSRAQLEPLKDEIAAIKDRTKAWQESRKAAAAAAQAGAAAARAAARSRLAFAGWGAVAVVGAQAARRLGNALEVTGDQAFTVEGKF